MTSAQTIIQYLTRFSLFLFFRFSSFIHPFVSSCALPLTFFLNISALIWSLFHPLHSPKFFVEMKQSIPGRGNEWGDRCLLLLLSFPCRITWSSVNKYSMSSLDTRKWLLQYCSYWYPIWNLSSLCLATHVSAIHLKYIRQSCLQNQQGCIYWRLAWGNGVKDCWQRIECSSISYQ